MPLLVLANIKSEPEGTFGSNSQYITVQRQKTACTVSCHSHCLKYCRNCRVICPSSVTASASAPPTAARSSSSAMGHGATEKPKARSIHASLLTVTVVSVLVLLYGWQLLEHWGPQQQGGVPEVQQFPTNVQQLRLRQNRYGEQVSYLEGAAADAAAAPELQTQGEGSLPAATLEYFPQTARCPTRWMQQSAQLQADIESGAIPPRYFVSVAVEAGLADRLAGLMTHFWHAVLTGRAFKTVAYGDVPAFSAMCDAPFIDWTTPPDDLPAEAIEPLKFTYKGVRGYPGNERALPDSLDPNTYQMLYLVNGPSRNLTVYQNSNISTLMSPDPAYILAASNRGRTFAMANNPNHKQQFWEYGVTPTDAFMCGFFFMCSPVAAIQDYYKKYWDALREPGVLKIGIQIRLGDSVFKQEEQQQPVEEVLKLGAEWFVCAQRLEKAYAAPGQKVLWYLNSDSQQLRRAAKVTYGSKLITDDELRMTHPDCHQDKPEGNSSAACQQAAMDVALQHSLGAMLTFSLTDYHIISKASGFGRLGAWLSGRWNNIYQVVKGQGTCSPGKFIPPEQSAFHYSGV